MDKYVKDWSIEIGKIVAEMVGESVINHSGIRDIVLLCKLGNRVWSRVCNNAIDHSVEVLNEREKKLSTIISKITSQELPDDFKEYYQVINAAAEICLDRLYIFHYKYDVENTANLLAKEYIRKNQKMYGDEELGLLRNHLKKILQETITSIQDELHTNPEFTKKWRSYVEITLEDHQDEIEDLKKQNILISERIDCLDIRVEHVENDVSIMKKDMETSKSNNKKIKVRECSSDYKMNWNDVLFLEDPDSEKSVYLKDIYILPTYQNKDNDDNIDLHEVLQGVIDAGDDFRKRMLVILGQPGGGKTTLMTYLLNKCKFQQDRTVRMYCFRKFKQVNWKNTDEIFSQMLDSMHLQEKDLNDSILILDGLDEVNMGNRQTEFLNDIYLKYIRTENIKNFSLFLTCRNNRIEKIEDLTPRYINLNFLDEEQIGEFVDKYDKIKGTDNNIIYIDVLQKLKEVLGIPLILYMILALHIKIEKETNLIEVYKLIFSTKNENSIYKRKNYNHMQEHVITANEIEEIHQFSKEIAINMWKDRNKEAVVKKEDYERIAGEVASNVEVRDLLIGQYFMEGKDSCELYFVHRSMYQYFVALSIFDAIKDMIEQGKPDKQFEKLIENCHDQKNSCIIPFARIIGIDLIYSDPDIEQYLLYMLKNLSIEDEQWWKTFFVCFLDKGLTRYCDSFNESTIKCFEKEVNRFYNLIWLTREQLRNIDSSNCCYKITKVDEKFRFYLRSERINADLEEIDLSEADLGGVNLNGINLNGADLSGADLGGVNLEGADLGGANLNGADLGRANLSGVNLIGANLNGVDLGGANLNGADLFIADLGGANLSGANLEGANLGRANLSGVDLSGANLNGANLGRANLEGADLEGADLLIANLSGANLSGANLEGANLGRANLSGANLEGAYLKVAFLNDIIIDKEELHKAILDEENCKKFFGEESE